MLTMSSKLKLEPGDYTIDPVLAGIVHVHKRIGDRVYQAYLPAKYLRTKHHPPYLECFPDRHPRHDARPIPLPIDWQPRDYLVITAGDTMRWQMSVAEFDQLEWVADEPMPMPAANTGALVHFYQQFHLTPHHSTDHVIAAIAGDQAPERRRIQQLVNAAPDLPSIIQQILLEPSPAQQELIDTLLHTVAARAAEQLPSEQLAALQHHATIAS